MKKLYLVLLVCCVTFFATGTANAKNMCSELTGSFKNSCELSSTSAVCKANCKYYVSTTSKYGGGTASSELKYRENKVKFNDDGTCTVSNDKINYTLTNCASPLGNDNGYLMPESQIQ